LGGSYYTRISLADIDNDGDLDMFYGGGDCGSLVYFENVGTSQEPLFQLAFEVFPGLENISLFGGTVDVDFGDLDADGDLDAAHSRDLDRGGEIRWNDGTPEEPYFVWRYPLGPLSGQSSVTLIDIDADGDLDYFSGHGSRGFEMCFAENIGTIEVPDFEQSFCYYQDLDFGGTFNFDMGDVDEDGDFDLLVCKVGGDIGFYENIGTPSEPNFVLTTDDFLPDREYNDWLETPELADIDGDGDLDLFLAGAYAHLFYFENLGIDHNPQFILRSDTSYFYTIPPMWESWLSNSVDIDGDGDDDIMPGHNLFLNESSSGDIKFRRVDDVIPFVVGSFADLDGDGDFDYMIPSGTYTVGYYENIGDSTWPIWDSFRELFPTDGRIYHVWTVTSGDVDNDGDYDLLVAHENNRGLSLYRNDGSPYVYDFVYAGELNLPEWQFRSSFDALLEDIDADGDLDLLIGERRLNEYTDVRLMFYRNDGTLEEPAWTHVSDDFQNVIQDHRNGNVVPCLSDVDNDGDKDLVTTNNSIGLQLFLNPLDPTDVSYDSGNDTHRELSLKASIRPNPFNSRTMIRFSLPHESNVMIKIYDVLGRKIATVFDDDLPLGTHQITWKAAGVSSGVYFCRILAGELQDTKKMLLLR
jgi:hypothetical protein